MCKEKILEILENAKDGNGTVPMRLVRQAFDKLPEPCEDTISRQAAIDAVNNAFDRETLLTGFVRSIAVRAIRDMPFAQPEERTEERTETRACDLISRQAAIDAYGDWYVEEGTADGFIGTVKQLLEGLPPAQPERTCVNCGRTANNGGWYADGGTRCPIEEHYALPKDGYCHLWEKRNITDDDYPERRTDG